MDDDIAGIDQHPVCRGQAFDADVPEAALLDSLGQFLRHGGDLASRTTAGDYHVIGDRGLAFERDRDDFLRLVVIQRLLPTVKTASATRNFDVLGGAIFTETVYSLPGLGRTSVQALNNYDVPTVMGVIVFSTIIIIIFNLIVDLLYAAIDPRIRLA